MRAALPGRDSTFRWLSSAFNQAAVYLTGSSPTRVWSHQATPLRLSDRAYQTPPRTTQKPAQGEHGPRRACLDRAKAGSG